MTYSTRETIDTYEPRLNDLQPLDRRAIYHRGEYQQCTGFSEYLHDDLCVAMASFCGRDSYTNPWRFAGQTSYVWPKNLSKADVMKWQEEHKQKEIFSSTKIFQIKFWKPVYQTVNNSTINPLNQINSQQPMQLQQQQMMQLQQHQIAQQQMMQTQMMQQQQMVQQQQQQQALQMQQRQMQVTCPQGVGTGQQIQIMTPSGKRLAVVIPQGIKAGDTFVVNI